MNPLTEQSLSRYSPNAFAKLRQDALHLFQKGIAAADPYLAVKHCLHFKKNVLSITENTAHKTVVRSGKCAKIYVLAFGKAACAMAKAAQEIIPVSLWANESVIVTSYENLTALKSLQVFGAAHPIPDKQGVKAAKLIAATAKNAQQGELVLVLISGGGSALISAPLPPLSLAEKIATTNLLLASCANISQINCVRKHLSYLKGGRLAELIYPADCHALILSDVLGDDVSVIASGTTVADNTSYADAIEILENYQIWAKVPNNVRWILEQGRAGRIVETPKSDSVVFTHTQHTLVGSNIFSVNAVLQAANNIDYETQLYSDNLCGIAREEAEKLAIFVKQQDTVNNKRLKLWVAGGETTVHVVGTGRGGRNQEMALAFAIAAKKLQLPDNWVFLSGGTDGRDGATDAAGAIVDPGSLQRMLAAGIDPERCLANNDSYTALESSGDLIKIGATGTNVADLQILLLLPS